MISFPGEKTSDAKKATAELKRQSVRGGTVTLLSQVASLVIQTTSTVVLARLLQPGDFGVVAMVTAVTAFAGLFRDLGLSSSTIQRKDLTHDELSTLFWINVGAGALLTVIVASCAPLVALFYGRPELSSVTVAMALTFVVGGLSTQHGALMVRKMMFGRRAIATVTGSIVAVIVSISLALKGWGYWAVVAGTICGSTATTSLMMALSSWWPGRPVWSGSIRGMLKYGANIAGFDIVNYFARNLDNILIGRFWGAEPLGLYSRAYTLLMLPISQIRAPINTVAFPAMSRLKDDPEGFRAYYVRVTAILGFLSMPLTAFLAAAAGPVVVCLLGSQWTGVIPIFTILAVSGFIQPVAGLRGMVLLACGHGGLYLRWGILNAVCTSVAFGCGLPWGATGIATAYALVNYLLLYPSIVILFKFTPLRTADFFGAIARPAVASIIAGAVVFALIRQLAAWSPLSAALSAGVVFGFTYLAIYAVLPGGRAELQSNLGLWNQWRHK